MNDMLLSCTIIDYEPWACDRMKGLLEGFDSIEIMGIFHTYLDALAHLKTSRPDVIFLDVELDQNHTAFEIIEHCHAEYYFPYFILTTSFEHYSIKAIKNNVFDYLVKPIDIEELKETLNRLNKHLSSPYLNLIRANGSLSVREKEVLELVSKGLSSKQISSRLHISKSTVDSHRKNILQKTGAKSTLELLHTSRNPKMG